MTCGSKSRITYTDDRMTCFNCELNCPPGPSMCIPSKERFARTLIKSKPTTSKRGAYERTRLSIYDGPAVIGCGFSGMYGAMRARDFLGDVLVVDKGPETGAGWAGFPAGT